MQVPSVDIEPGHISAIVQERADTLKHRQVVFVPPSKANLPAAKMNNSPAHGHTILASQRKAQRVFQPKQLKIRDDAILDINRLTFYY